MNTADTTCHLLIVEDNPADIRLMTEAIRKAGLDAICTMRITLNAEDALSALETSLEMHSHYDIILLDLNMPRINGKEVLAKIKADEKFSRIPVFIMSSSDYSVDIRDCERLGADAFFQKPADFGKFIDFFVSIKDSLDTNQCISVPAIIHRYNTAA